MNERIKELYKKAWGHFPCPTGEPELEKFAELIVKECVGRVRYCIQNDLDYIAEDIEQHFGVEE